MTDLDWEQEWAELEMEEDWEGISLYPNLPEFFIEKYMDCLDIVCIIQTQKLSIPFIQKYQHLDYFWEYLSYNEHLTDEILETFIDKWHWKVIVEHVLLSETFIEKYKHKLDWEDVIHYQKLSLPFIQKYEKEIKLSSLSCNIYITEEIIEYYQEKWEWNWNYLLTRNLLSFEDVKKCMEHLELKILEFVSFQFTEEQWKEIKAIKEKKKEQ